MTEPFIVGVNETPYMGPGWFEREIEGRLNQPQRFAGEVAWLRRDNADAIANGIFLVTAAPTILRQPIVVTIHGAHSPQESSARRLLATWHFSRGDWQVQRVAMPAGNAWLRFSTSPAFIPHAHLSNGDHRRLGFQLAAWRWTT